MGRLLAALIADSETAPPANPAKVANLATEPVARFADSQDSQGVALASATDQTERLLAELRRQSMPDEWLGLDHGDIAELVALTDGQLSAYVRMLADSDLRRRGKVPADETAMGLCRGCGPVWLHPSVAALAPKVNGWPVVLGCPWCHVRHAGLFVPRPKVTCAGCRHFDPDAVGHGAGMGRCSIQSNVMRYPHERHACADWQPDSGGTPRQFTT